MTSRQHWRTATAVHVFVFALAVVVTMWIEWTRPQHLTQIDESIRDAILRLVEDDTPDDRIAIVDVNEASISAEGPWPWPRAKIAALIETLLQRYQARALAIDIVFPDAADPEGDARLAALAMHGPITLSQIFDYAERVQKVDQGVLTGGELNSSGHASISASGFIANHQGLSGSDCVGNIGYIPDGDGVLRKIPLHTRHGAAHYLHLSYALLECWGGGAVRLVTDDQGFWRVPFTKSLSAYTVVPAHEVLAERAADELLHDRYIIIGSSSLSQGDRVSTPLAPLSSGMLVHASSLSAMLDLKEGKMNPAWSGRSFLVLWVISSFFITILVMLRGAVWGNTLCISVFVTLWLAISVWGVLNQATWSIVAPMTGYLLLFGLGVPYEWRRSQLREKKLIERFSHYVAKSVLDKILLSDFAHSLEPQLREITVLVADMENYTATTSALSLPEAAALTKAFLRVLTHPVLECDGTLDKYTGDGLVAFWGAPLPCDDRADRAIDAAKGMLAMIEAFNAERVQQGQKALRVRIGIESGTALVGDLGTDFRSTYTAVGDCINFASRLQEAARKLPTDIVIGPYTQTLLKRHPTTSIGHISLRGVTQPIDVFRVSLKEDDQ